jgi:hypothetical protein
MQPQPMRDVNLVLTGNLRCPKCGAVTALPIPADQCLIVYECPGCRTIMRPLPGDCCVFCSYADVPCLPMQIGMP